MRTLSTSVRRTDQYLIYVFTYTLGSCIVAGGAFSVRPAFLRVSPYLRERKVVLLWGVLTAITWE
jgi:hypothetical protein